MPKCADEDVGLYLLGYLDMEIALFLSAPQKCMGQMQATNFTVTSCICDQ